MAARRLTREKSGAMLGGVCAGIANTYNVDVTIVRVAFVLLTLFTSGLGLVFYVAAWLVMPAAGQTSLGASEIARANVDDVVSTARQRAADLTRVRPSDVKSGARRAAEDLKSAAQNAKDMVSGRAASSASPGTGASWTPPEANPRGRHGGFKPPQSRPPVDRT
ncbi:MAG: PspC domain-containing protein [Dehalococcoidia bacterium]|nr:PspC domain-containing protein [Dehalococcoidia bacterium]